MSPGVERAENIAGHYKVTIVGRRCCFFDHKSAEVRRIIQYCAGFRSAYLPIGFIQRTYFGRCSVTVLSAFL
ncbi:MAG: hypothetical protein ACC646_11085, partial [Paracoccaceae bacterium]